MRSLVVSILVGLFMGVTFSILLASWLQEPQRLRMAGLNSEVFQKYLLEKPQFDVESTQY